MTSLYDLNWPFKGVTYAKLQQDHQQLSIWAWWSDKYLMHLNLSKIVLQKIFCLMIFLSIKFLSGEIDQQNINFGLLWWRNLSTTTLTNKNWSESGRYCYWLRYAWDEARFGFTPFAMCSDHQRSLPQIDWRTGLLSPGMGWAAGGRHSVIGLGSSECRCTGRGTVARPGRYPPRGRWTDNR